MKYQKSSSSTIAEVLVKKRSHWLWIVVALMSLSVITLLFPAQSIGNEQVASVVVSSAEQKFNLREVAQTAVDQQNRLLSDILAFDGWEQSWPASPLSEEESLWLRLNVRSLLPVSESFYLTIADPNIDYVDVYVIDSKQRITQSFQAGAKRDFSLRPVAHRHFIMPFTVYPNDDITLYIRLSDPAPMFAPISLMSADLWVLGEQSGQVMFGIFVGALMVFTLYFLVTYLLMKSPVRFWFSLTCFTLLLTVLNIQGFVGQMTGVTQFSHIGTTLLITLLLLMMAQVSRSLFVGSPKRLRYLAYGLPLAVIVGATVVDYSVVTMVMVTLIGLSILVQCLMAIHYRNRFNSRPSHFFVLGWLMIALAASVNLSLYSSGDTLTFGMTFLIILMSVLGVLIIGVAIEANERVLLSLERNEQEKRIDSLKQFYQLFRNSAEGLYTSTPEGELLSVNPAMWQLFGYESEDDMLSSVSSTNDFYAEHVERDVLIGELRANHTVLGREFRGLRKDGSEFWFSLSCQLHEEGEQTFLYGSIFDVTERKQSNISLEYLATHDSLTGVNNRREFERQLQSQLAIPLSTDSPLTVLYMDLDQFKVVNDTCGHKAGDALLQQLATILDEVVSDKGLLSRLGGDEFGVLMTETGADQAFVLANKLLNAVSDFRFMWENKVFSLGLSIGLVERSATIDTPEQMMSMADAACYIAKEQGRNQIHRYSSQDVSTKRYENELNWLAYINEALESDNFVLYYQHYQPLHELAAGHRYELLLRMQTADQGLVPPGAFLPAAERYSLGAKVDRWVIHHYFQWLNENPEHAEQLCKCNINLCGQSLADRDFKLFVLNAFEKFSVPYNKICFEITEGMAIIKMEDTLEFIKTFKQLGCTFALDDFGSGFSSYGYLKQLPVQYVKIDGAFVKDLTVDPIDSAMVRSINDVAKAMGMETVAEFVENTDIKIELGKMGVDYAQGYGIAMPAPLDEYVPFGE